MLNGVLCEDRDGLRVVQANLIVPQRVRIISRSATCLVDAVYLSRLRLGQLHEDDGAFRDDRVDDKRGEHDDQHGAERKTEVALVSPHVAIRVFQEELEGGQTAQTPVNIFLDFGGHQS